MVKMIIEVPVVSEERDLSIWNDVPCDEDPEE